jgi:hypothetical protein
MSTTNEISRNTLVVGDGIVTTIPFAFNYIQQDENVNVVVTVKNDLTLVETTFVEGTDFLISGNSIVLAFPLPVGFTLLIERSTETIQRLDYDETAPFPAETHEALSDRIFFALSELKNLFNRAALLGKFEDTLLRVVLPTPVNGQYLAWDGITGKLKNASTTIDPLLLDAEDVVYDNTFSSLVAANVEAALNELDDKVSVLELEVSNFPRSFGRPVIKWFDNATGSFNLPVLVSQNAFEVYDFNTLDKATTALEGIFRVPQNYSTVQMFLRFKAYVISAGAGNAQFSLTSRIYRSSATTPLASASINSSAVTVSANTIVDFEIQITTGLLQIGGQLLNIGDLIKFELLNNGVGNTLIDSIYVIKDSTEVIIV